MMRINRNKRIGNVIFVVEGKKSEPKLIRDVFQKIFGFDVYQANKNEDLIEFVDDRLGHDFRYLIDDSKIQELGFKHKYEFEEKLIELTHTLKKCLLAVY